MFHKILYYLKACLKKFSVVVFMLKGNLMLVPLEDDELASFHKTFSSSTTHE